jgi:hypothetical protein
MKKIDIPKDFSTTPGGRFIEDGPFSGEEFRATLLQPLFEDKEDKEFIEISFDGAEGYQSSFLEEAFGGLVREVKDKARVKNRLKFVSENRVLIDKVHNYIEKV